MKAKYINPTIKIKEVLTMSLMAGSLSTSPDPATGDDALSKSLNAFEDEENSPKNGSFDVWED